jgi:alpha-L-fucosidase
MGGFIAALLGAVWLVMAATTAESRGAEMPNQGEPPVKPKESRAQHDARMAWWREARFGLFIHWGLYSEIGGEWGGRQTNEGVGGGLGEWIMYNDKIPVVDYAREAAKFNPVDFDANAWVKIAKEAGVKYIVITAKHHEGFAMFKSDASSFNIVDATPYKHDPLKDLARACSKAGIRLGFYYSQAQDWHHPGGAAWGGGNSPWSGGNPVAGHWDPAQAGSFGDYIDRIAVPQVRELLSNYGKISVLWWDTPIGMTPDLAKRFEPLLALQPGIITNDRLLDRNHLTEFSGDTETPEQSIPPTGIKDRDFEVCMTMNDSWGYKAHDQNWKSSTELIRKLVDVVSKGGNLLLNVGPDGLGRIPQPSVERLQTIGRWIAINGESIYGSNASPFAKLPWGRCTRKVQDDRVVLYLHVFDWPHGGRLLVPGLKSGIQSARLLATGSTLTTESNGESLVVHVPATAPDPVDSVIRLDLSGPLEVSEIHLRPAADGSILFPLWMADIYNPEYGGSAHLGSEAGQQAIVGWTDWHTHLAWKFEADKPGLYEIVGVLQPAEAGGGLSFHIGQESVTAVLQPNDSSQPVVMGQLKVSRPGLNELELRPKSSHWQPTILRSIKLVPVTKSADNAK